LFDSIFKPPIGIKGIGSGPVFFLHGLVDLLPQHSDFPWRTNAKPDLVAAHPDDRHNNIVANRETLAGSATQYQHGILLVEKVEEAGLGSRVSIC
jgi:hypothetical protein